MGSGTKRSSGIVSISATLFLFFLLSLSFPQPCGAGAPIFRWPIDNI